jgi:hypothetical protein
MSIFNENGDIQRERLKPLNDSFRKDRGGSSEFLDLFCTSCDSYIGTYQKDGSGNLHRLYVDRIHTPYEQYEGPFNELKSMPALHCPNPQCDAELATPMIYTKENRLAYRIISSIRKRRNYSGKYPPEDINKEDLFVES